MTWLESGVDAPTVLSAWMKSPVDDLVLHANGTLIDNQRFHSELHSTGSYCGSTPQSDDADEVHRQTGTRQVGVNNLIRVKFEELEKTKMQGEKLASRLQLQKAPCTGQHGFAEKLFHCSRVLFPR